MAEERSELPLKHEEFAHHLFDTGNASEAARRAGYASTNAAHTGSRLAKRPEIQERVDEIRTEAWADFKPEVAVARLITEMEKAEFSRDRINAAVSALKGSGNWASQDGPPTQQLHIHNPDFSMADLYPMRDELRVRDGRDGMIDGEAIDEPDREEEPRGR